MIGHWKYLNIGNIQNKNGHFPEQPAVVDPVLCREIRQHDFWRYFLT